MRTLVLAAALCIPFGAFAAGDSGNNPPKPTNTTKSCWGKRVWDADKQKCVRPDKSSLNTQELYDAARELAYAGRPGDAQSVLEVMPNQNDDRVLTYWGFTHRKMGNLDLANDYYQAALRRNPDNLLARSYMGQGLVSEGRIEEAILQWKEIRARGGEGTWPETSLRAALETGLTYNY
ncbi:MAG: tetratricopeptide repeat protein [Paracoccaceae bacterium]